MLDCLIQLVQFCGGQHPQHQLVGCIVIEVRLAEQQILFYLHSLEQHMVLVMDQQPSTFLRLMMTVLFGVGDGSGGLDPGRTFGSSQNSDIGNHSHTSNSAQFPHNHTVNSNANQMPHNHQFVISAATCHTNTMPTLVVQTLLTNTAVTPPPITITPTQYRRENRSNPGNNYSGHWNTNSPADNSMMRLQEVTPTLLVLQINKILTVIQPTLVLSMLSHTHPTTVGTSNAHMNMELRPLLSE